MRFTEIDQLIEQAAINTEISDKDLFCHPAYRRYLEDMARTAVNGVTLRLCHDNSPDAMLARTYEKTIELNTANQLTQLFQSRKLKHLINLGLLGHEESHILFGSAIYDDDAYDSLERREWFPCAPASSLPEDRRCMQEIKTAFENVSFRHFFHATRLLFVEVFDDYYCETRMKLRYPGTYKSGIQLTEWAMFQRMPAIHEMEAEDMEPFHIFYNSLLVYSRFGYLKPNRRQHSEQEQDIRGRIELLEPLILQAKKAMDEKVRWDIANLLFIRIWDFVKQYLGPPIPQAEPQNDEGTDQCQPDKSGASGVNKQAQDGEQPQEGEQSGSDKPGSGTQESDASPAGQGSTESEQGGDDSSSTAADPDTGNDDQGVDNDSNDADSPGNQEGNIGNSDIPESENNGDSPAQSGSDNETGDSSSQDECDDSMTPPGGNEQVAADESGDGDGNSEEGNSQPQNGPQSDFNDAEGNRENDKTSSDAPDYDEQGNPADGAGGGQQKTGRAEESGCENTGTTYPEPSQPSQESVPKGDSGDERSEASNGSQVSGQSRPSGYESNGGMSDAPFDGFTAEQEEAIAEKSRSLMDSIPQQLKPLERPISTSSEEISSRDKREYERTVEEKQQIAPCLDNPLELSDSYEMRESFPVPEEEELDGMIDELNTENLEESINQLILSEHKLSFPDQFMEGIHKNVRFQLIREAQISNSLISLYEEVEDTVQSISKELQRDIRSVFDDRKRGITMTGRFMGPKIVGHHLYRMEGNFFGRKVLPNDNPDICMGILIDISGSTSVDSRYYYEMMAAQVLYDFCVALEIPVTVVGHTERFGGSNPPVDLYLYAAFERVDPNDRYRMMDIRPRENNRDGAALRYIGEQLMKRTEPVKLLISLSDGLPHANRYSGVPAEQDVCNIRNDLTAQGITVIAAAIGDDKENIQKCYQEGFLDITNLEELPYLLVGLLKEYM